VCEEGVWECVGCVGVGASREGRACARRPGVRCGAPGEEAYTHVRGDGGVGGGRVEVGWGGDPTLRGRCVARSCADAHVSSWADVYAFRGASGTVSAVGWPQRGAGGAWRGRGRWGGRRAVVLVCARAGGTGGWGGRCRQGSVSTLDGGCGGCSVAHRGRTEKRTGGREGGGADGGTYNCSALQPSGCVGDRCGRAWGVSVT